MIKAFIAAGLTLVLATMFAVTMPAQSFAQVNGGNGAVDATDRGGGGGGGFGGGTGGSGANGGSNGGIGTGGNGAGLGGGGAGVGGGGGGFPPPNFQGSPGSGTINGLSNAGTISGGSGGSDGGATIFRSSASSRISFAKRPSAAIRGVLNFVLWLYILAFWLSHDNLVLPIGAQLRAAAEALQPRQGAA